MIGFLAEVAKDIYAKKGQDISRSCLIFPSQRAKIAFQGELARQITSPLWKPLSLGMDELIANLSEHKVPSQLELLALLYQCYSKLMQEQGQNPESFDQFYAWGEIMLADFDAIDKQMADADLLLTNVEDLRSIDEMFHSEEMEQQVRTFWEAGLRQPNAAFVRMWKLLYPLYAAFREKLTERSWAYAGMQYREAAENMASFEQDTHHIFIGFNALNPCEKIICDRLKESGAWFYWDYDEYYLHETHEAGTFIRENLQRYGNELKGPHQKICSQKDIRIYAAESDILQCKLAGSLAKGPSAIVLVDEQLLLPCIHSIPEDVQQELNITMGYPFRLSLNHARIKSWLQLQLGSYALGNNQLDHHFFAQDILRYLDCGFVEGKAVMADELRNYITSKNQKITSTDDLDPQWLTKDFALAKDGQALIRNLIEILDQRLFHIVREDPANTEDFEQLSLAYEHLQKLEQAILGCGLELSVPMAARLISKAFHSLNMTLESDRLSQLQIMGFLETRAMDFENLILVSANDDKLPGNSSQISFIPFSIRCAFGLPTHKEKEAMYAYYFYRLLQRSEHIHLIYNNSTADNNSGEMSRYLQQLQLELFEHPLPIQRISLQTDLFKGQALQFEKKGEAWERFLEKPYLSASSINDFLECGLRFYFKKIARIKEPAELSTELDHSAFGSLIHESMQDLYTEFIGKGDIRKDALKALLDDPQRIKAVLHKHYPKYGLSPDFGEGVIMESVCTAFISRIIRFDTEKRGEFSIYGLEHKIEPVPLKFRIDDKEISVLMNAVFDRIDREAGRWHVIDYKTGSAKTDHSKEHRQALLYRLLMEKIGLADAKPMLYFVQQMHSDDFKAEIEFNETNDTQNEFYLELERTFATLFNPDIPFSECENKDKCKYCTYIHICETKYR